MNDNESMINDGKMDNVNGSVSNDWLLPKRSIIIDISFGLLTILIILCNISCIYKIGKSFRRYRSNTFYSAARLLIILLIIINTLSMILVSSIVIPSQLAGFWIGGIYTCNSIAVWIEIWTHFVTFLATIISMERYIAIKKPFRYNHLCSPLKIKLLLILIFIVSTTIGIVSLFLNKFALIAHIPICQVVIYNFHQINSLEYVTLWLDLACFIPCCCVLLVTTMAVLLELKRMSVRVSNLSIISSYYSPNCNNGTDIQQTKKLARIVVMITLLHLLCWIPQRVSRVNYFIFTSNKDYMCL